MASALRPETAAAALAALLEPELRREVAPAVSAFAARLAASARAQTAAVLFYGSALHDDAHVVEQKTRYRARRELLKPAVEAAGFRIDRSEAGLYLWATEGRDAWESLDRLTGVGILAGPGHFYGDHFPQHVRFSLTATDERIAAAAERLHAL